MGLALGSCWLLWLLFMMPICNPSRPDFYRTCAEHRQTLVHATLNAGAIGQVAYYPATALERTQSTFSFDRLLKALGALIDEGKIQPDEFLANIGQAVYPPDRYISGVFYKGRIYIVDGHHRALLTTYLGATTIPVKVLSDWSGQSTIEFFARLEREQLSSFRGLNGEALGPGPFCEMIDDPMLLLARKLLLRVDLNFDETRGEVEILRTRGAKVPIAFKINRDVPFYEQEIAWRLREAGETWVKGDEIENADRQRYLAVLKSKRDNSRLRQVLLLDQPTPVAELKITELLKIHFKRHRCEYPPKQYSFHFLSVTWTFI